MSNGSTSREGGVVAEVIRALYTNLLLRDLFGKAAPGMVILLTIAISLTSFGAVFSKAERANFGIWMLAVALAWLTGLVAQAVGELLWLRYFPKDVDLDTWQETLNSFHAKRTSIQEREFERLTVITEASGNGSVALFLAALVVRLTTRPNTGELITSVVVISAAATALLMVAVPLVLMHQEMVRRRYKYLLKSV